MAILPARNIFDGTATPVTSTMKTAMGSLRDYLAALLGTDSSNTAAARSALGAAKSGENSDITSLTALTSINGGQLAGMRNRIINGSMQVRQRGPVAASASYEYTADRIRAIIFGGTGISGIYNPLEMSGTSSNSALWFSGSFTNGALTFDQPIESFNCTDLNGKTITVSGKLFQDTGSTQNIVVRLNRAGSLNNFAGESLIANSGNIAIPDSTVTSFSFTYTLGASDATNGIRAIVVFPSLTVVNKYIAFSDFQLELGPVATPFEQRPYGLELALCQRYYYKETVERVNLGVGASDGSVLTGLYVLPMEMRASPTCTFAGAWRVLPNGAPTGTPVAVELKTRSFRWTSSFTSTPSYAYVVQGGDGNTASMEFSAEL